MPRRCHSQTFSLQATQAATITVNTLVDNGASCTLRDAIANINAGSDQSNDCIIAGTLGTNDTINFSPGLTNDTILLSYGKLSFNNDAEINGSGITIDGANGSRVIYVNNSALTLNQITITNGSAGVFNGGGISAYNNSSVSLNNSNVIGNSAFSGGGIFVFNHSSISLTDSTINENSATFSSSGILADDNSSASLINSTISNNTSDNAAGGIAAHLNSIVSLNNSTVTGNSAAVWAGGIYAKTNSTVSLSNSTITDNSANTYGGIFAQSTSSINLSNSIVAGNSASSFVEIRNNGTITADQNNLFGHSGLIDAVAFFNFTPGVSDIKTTSDGTSVSLSNILNSLADNGGSTLTHSLVEGSPAIDAGDAAACTAAPINNRDQRGKIRPTGSCDIGSYEIVDESGFIVIPLLGNKAVVIPSG